MPWCDVLLKMLNLKGLNMIKKNPEDSVREEQFGAIKMLPELRKPHKTEKAEDIESPADSEKEQEKEETVNESDRVTEEKVIPVSF